MSPSQARTAVLTASDAIETAQAHVHGNELAASTAAVAALALIEDLLAPQIQDQPASDPPVKLRLAWVVQLEGVLIHVSGPSTGRHDRGPITGTAQWVIDATVGDLVSARDFGNTSGSAAPAAD